MRIQTELSAIKGLGPAQIARLLPPVSPAETFAKAIWNKLGGEMDWNGIALLCELHDVTDPEALIDDLISIRNALKQQT